MGHAWNPETQRLEDVPATCWRLSAGRWTAQPIEGGSLELSELRHAPGTALPCAVDGKDDEHWAVTRFTVEEVASRVVPHAIWYFAPAFFGCEAPAAGWGGRAFTTGGVVALRTSQNQQWTVEATYHEAWHVLEHLLTRSERAAVDAAVARGGEWTSAYYDSAVERRARAFEAWSMHRHEAPPMDRTGYIGSTLDAVHRWTAPAHERVFDAAFTGRIGKRAAARRWVAGSRLSPEARAQAAADREAARDRWIRDASWGAIAASALSVVGMTVHHWLA